jgi:small subunit ribosomal protein S11
VKWSEETLEKVCDAERSSGNLLSSARPPRNSPCNFFWTTSNVQSQPGSNFSIKPLHRHFEKIRIYRNTKIPTRNLISPVLWLVKNVAVPPSAAPYPSPSSSSIWPALHTTLSKMSKSILWHLSRHTIRPTFLTRPFSVTSTRADSTPDRPSIPGAEFLQPVPRPTRPPPPPSNAENSLTGLLERLEGNTTPGASQSPAIKDGYYAPDQKVSREPHHLHCYATKHNTHVTLTRPNRDSIISISCGNLGFRKAQRGTYEAAFQTVSWVMREMETRGLLSDPPHRMSTSAVDDSKYVTNLEVVLRGYAEGRTAFISALTGVEGRLIRPRVIKVSDGTRLKFGGTRSPNPRRL